MCDIWKGNSNLKQLTEDDVNGLLVSLKKLGTSLVLMSGGEALLNPNFFRLCQILRNKNIRISLLSTGLSLEKNAKQLVEWVNEIIVSLDGPSHLHDQIRNIPGAYEKMAKGIKAIRQLQPSFPVKGRSVVHGLNFEFWNETLDAAWDLGLDQISFLPADVTSHAFNREILWSEQRREELLIGKDDLPALRIIIEDVIARGGRGWRAGFIAESPERLRDIYSYYAAFHGLNPFPCRQCNAPWVSTVVEADGTVRPCFFHPPLGNIHKGSLHEILNNPESIRFRKNLDMDNDMTCTRCVCRLHLSPTTKLN
jgi:radical SAM protein with 4Fe4S-binding SPASM domain